MLDPTGRVLQLLSLLQTHRFWPGSELAARLAVSPRTLRRDIERLRDLGYPVDATPGVDGGYRLGAGAHLPPMLLDDDEAVAIAVGLRASAGAALSGLDDISLRALTKLEGVLPERLRRRVDAVYANSEVLVWGATGPPIDTEALALLGQGCRDHEEVRFEYVRRDGETGSRLVQPHQLVSAGRRWYLVAWDVRRDDWRTFRVDRITDLRLAGARFTPRRLPTPDAAAFVAKSIRAMPSAHQATVVVDAPAEEVAERLRWLDAEPETREDGRCQVVLRADTVAWLVPLITTLAIDHPIEVDSDDEVLAALAAVRTNLAAGH